MRIGILGSGLIGAKLGVLFARVGHDVTFSYSRNARKLESLARDAGPRARGGTPHDAARNADVVLLAVHWSQLNDVLEQAGSLAGKNVITCMVPLNEANTQLVVPNTSSGAERLAEIIPEAKVVCAFNTVPSEALFGVFERRSITPRPSLVYCGDDAQSKDITVELIRDVGFDPVDAGPLRTARYMEPFAMLGAQLAYGGAAGPELTYRFEWL
ncbi:NADPH-dependent F420 reductase [Noviherbaspirillum pedocola]|uniref:NADPH-dependent F420 reductase n=1 Tax=Noviherbaspirillum pedocola TaxID=2801341 RepID=A0A934W984_9BURK|nr:NADPH-dependent F420 reductase [Noviherbaspirillum pedocola]MBK4738520.1 NADPH-dependent F420 reductase [Noviherbaspirillum pedocola]